MKSSLKFGVVLSFNMNVETTTMKNYLSSIVLLLLGGGAIPGALADEVRRWKWLFNKHNVIMPKNFLLCSPSISALIS
jgi:hypothetical protein